MTQAPSLHTARLLLRPFVATDAPAVQRLAGDREIAATTMNIPHPYPDGAAEQWIASHEEAFQAGKTLTLAVTASGSGELLGTISLINIARPHRRAELAYWIGKAHWSKGYGTEATQALVEFAFLTLDLNRIEGRCLRTNAASARLMEKVGLTPEGCLRQHVDKWGRFEDMALYGLLRANWPADC